MNPEFWKDLERFLYRFLEASSSRMWYQTREFYLLDPPRMP